MNGDHRTRDHLSPDAIHYSSSVAVSRDACPVPNELAASACWFHHLSKRSTPLPKSRSRRPHLLARRACRFWSKNQVASPGRRLVDEVPSRFRHFAGFQTLKCFSQHGLRKARGSWRVADLPGSLAEGCRQWSEPPFPSRPSAGDEGDP